MATSFGLPVGVSGGGTLQTAALSNAPRFACDVQKKFDHRSYGRRVDGFRRGGVGNRPAMTIRSRP
jgi:hypothetical protein